MDLCGAFELPAAAGVGTSSTEVAGCRCYPVVRGFEAGDSACPQFLKINGALTARHELQRKQEGKEGVVSYF
jgi:hypothetical protein